MPRGRKFGPIRRLTDERRDLVARWFKLAKGIAAYGSRRYGLDLDEVESEVMMGLIRAAVTWKDDGGASFGPWAKRVCKYALYDWFKIATKNRYASLDDPHGHEAGMIANVGGNDKDMVAIHDEAERRLSSFEKGSMKRRIMDLVYRDDQTLLDTADAVNLSSRRTNEIHQEAINELRKEIGSEIQYNGRKQRRERRRRLTG